jgi:molybdate transport system substrate-binding protein
VIRQRWGLVLLALLVVEATVACSNPNPPVNEDNPGPTVTLPSPGAAGGPTVSGSIVIYAPTELTAVATRLVRGFMKQNPDADAKLVTEAPRLSMLRILGNQPGDVFISDANSISDFRAYDHSLPSSKGLASESLVIAVPKGNPDDVRTVDDLGDPPDDSMICSPEYMRDASALPLEEVTVPINEDSKPNCGSTTVDQVVAKKLKGALVPGSAAGYLRGNEIDRVRVSLTGNLVVPYYVIPLKNTDIANGFVNYVRSDDARRILEESGYEA